MDHSIFMDKDSPPSGKDLKEALGSSYKLWMEIRNGVLEKYPGGKEEWNFPGKKYGWSFRIKDKKRAIIYFLPRKVKCLPRSSQTWIQPKYMRKEEECVFLYPTTLP